MNWIATKLENFRARRRNWGIRRALHWELMHALDRYVGLKVHYVAVGADLLAPAESERPDVPPEYVTRMVGFDELRRYSDHVPGLDLEFLQQASARGDECTGNFLGDELVGYAFTTRARARVSEQLDVVIPPGFRYGYKAWTHEDHRRRSLSKMRGHFHFTTVPCPYEERGIWYVETHNYASLLHSYVRPRRRAMRMGFCGWLTLFGRQIPFNTRTAKWIGFEFVRRSDDGRRQYI